jgi:hypothetical protein
MILLHARQILTELLQEWFCSLFLRKFYVIFTAETHFNINMTVVRTTTTLSAKKIKIFKS